MVPPSKQHGEAVKPTADSTKPEPVTDRCREINVKDLIPDANRINILRCPAESGTTPAMGRDPSTQLLPQSKKRGSHRCHGRPSHAPRRITMERSSQDNSPSVGEVDPKQAAECREQTLNDAILMVALSMKADDQADGPNVRPHLETAFTGLRDAQALIQEAKS